MRKGKLGLVLNFYAVMGFVLFFFGQWMLCALLCAFVLVVEKDEWTSRQCLQAFFFSFVSVVADWIRAAIPTVNTDDPFSFIFSLNPLAMLGSVVDFIISLLILIFTIVGISRVSKGREANLPFVAKWANKAFGNIVKVQQTYQPPQAGAYPYPPVQQPQSPYAPPAAPVYPQQPDMTVPVYPQQPDVAPPPVYPQAGQVPPQNPPL